MLITLHLSEKKMSLKSFCECDFLTKEARKINESFSVSQKELHLKNYIDGKAAFEKRDVEYLCRWLPQDGWDSNRSSILMPIRDHTELLSITIKNFFDNNIHKKANVIVIDDRSEADIESLVVKNGFSYLRVDNDSGFNFSMLNNIAAKICHTLGSREIILWNSDLWCVKEEYFDELLKRHRASNSKISSSKLVYPPEELSLNGEVDTVNIINNFPEMSGGSWRETVQFGGSIWVQIPRSPMAFCPRHLKRFSSIDDPRVDCDRGMCFVTGALHIWNLDYFIELGGLNPSMAKNLQDADICLRAAVDGNIPMYFGKDIFFYHDESANFHSSLESKEDKKMLSDHVLFSKIWDDKIVKIIL